MLHCCSLPISLPRAACNRIHPRSPPAAQSPSLLSLATCWGTGWGSEGSPPFPCRTWPHGTSWICPPLGSQSRGWHGDAPVPALGLRTALPHARRGDRRPKEGPGQGCDGARDRQLFSARDNGVPRETSTGTGLPGWGSQQGEGSRLCSSPPRQQPWLWKSKQATGKLGVLPAAGWGWRDPWGRYTCSQLLLRSCAATGRQGDAQPAQLSLLCQGS